jgi:hypothetical protein
LLDHYRVHFLGSFVNACNNLGVEIEYVPKGCTIVARPVDVGSNSLFKKHVKAKYMSWQITEYPKQRNNNNENENINNNQIIKLPSPTKYNIFQWAFFACKQIPEAPIRKTFVSIGFVPAVRSIPPVPTIVHALPDFDDENVDDEKNCKYRLKLHSFAHGLTIITKDKNYILLSFF